mmetsp:Transcript_4805/g.13621  ORF Transcript_4805/g.13621 Transcript_4805/m.13621 type:complete len:226 (+) Transcript_4805:1068-1745(+)
MYCVTKYRLNTMQPAMHADRATDRTKGVERKRESITWRRDGSPSSSPAAASSYSSSFPTEEEDPLGTVQRRQSSTPLHSRAPKSVEEESPAMLQGAASMLSYDRADEDAEDGKSTSPFRRLLVRPFRASPPPPPPPPFSPDAAEEESTSIRTNSASNPSARTTPHPIMRHPSSQYRSTHVHPQSDVRTAPPARYPPSVPARIDTLMPEIHSVRLSGGALRSIHTG